MIGHPGLRAAAAALLAITLLCACSKEGGPGFNAAVRPGEDPAQSFPEAAILTVAGRVTYQQLRSRSDASARVPSVSLTSAPARFVDLVALEAGTGAEIQLVPVATGADGAFSMQVPRGRVFRIGALSSTRNTGGRVNILVRDFVSLERFMVVFDNPDTGQPFAVEQRLGRVEVLEPFFIALEPDSSPPAVGDRPAAVFHILDSALDVSEAVRAATGFPPPLVTLFWNATSTFGSFFAPDVPGFGPSVFLLGGDSALDNSDDQDPSVIRHEYGHAITAALSLDSSRGGAHGPDDTLYPSLAYSEGLANFFSAAVAGVAALVDSAAPRAGVPALFLLNLEDRRLSSDAITAARGIRSEFTVGEVLWDLVDGTEGRADADFDGVALPLAAFFNAYTGLRGEAVYASLIDLLQSLVNTGVAPAATVTALLAAPENQQLSFPPVGADIFPARLTLPASVTDTCQTRGLDDPTSDGVDVSSRFFQFTLGAAAPVTLRMTLLGGAAGTSATSTNIDLVLRNLDNTLARDTAGNTLTLEPGPQAAVELAAGTLAAGAYIVEITGRPSDAAGNFVNDDTADVTYRLDVTSP